MYSVQMHVNTNQRFNPCTLPKKVADAPGPDRDHQQPCIASSRSGVPCSMGFRMSILH